MINTASFTLTGLILADFLTFYSLTRLALGVA